LKSEELEGGIEGMEDRRRRGVLYVDGTPRGGTCHAGLEDLSRESSR